VHDEDCFSIELDLSPEARELPPESNAVSTLDLLSSKYADQQWQGLSLVEQQLVSKAWLADFIAIGAQRCAWCNDAGIPRWCLWGRWRDPSPQAVAIACMHAVGSLTASCLQCAQEASVAVWS
jgi:hypothetical protein